MKFLRAFLLSITLFFAVTLTLALGYFFAVTKDVVLDENKLLISDKTLVIYDQSGERVKQNVGVKQSTPIQLFPEHVKQAFVCVEDKRFFTHNGFDYRRFLRAFINNCKAGSYKEGASTISQQLIKNTHLSQEKTLKRKLREWKLTRALESAYTKDEILEKYLNTIYFGHGCFGITSASEFYFGKSPEALTIDESAILAGLVKSPNNFSPFRFPERCQSRKATVLRIMKNNGAITETEQNTALNAPLPLPSLKNDNNGYLGFVLDELTGLSEKIGFKIAGKTELFTYLDPLLQEEIASISKQDDCDSAVFVLDNTTNGFIGAYSSIGNKKRLPGSIIKPLLIYAPALEENLISPATPILDAPVNYNGYSPKNYDGTSHGYVSVRECVEKSLNVPAVKTLETLGVKKGVAYLEKMRLPIEEGDDSLALALGGMKNGFTLKDLVSAYSVFPNGGTYQEGAFLSKIKINGETVYERQTAREKVFSEDSAYLMTDILKSTVQNGTAKKLRALPFEIAGKTGTVGSANGNTDAYTLSFTANHVVGVWLGNADNTKIPHTGGGKPCEISLRVNEALYKDTVGTTPSFAKPSSIVPVAIDKAYYDNEHDMLLADKNAPAEYQFQELFKRSQIPLKESNLFSSPSIPAPTLHVTKNGVEIRFPDNLPNFYEYTVRRRDIHGETLIYEGSFTACVLDKNVKNDSVYSYLVTPKYKNFVGNTLHLPSISTKKNAIQDGEILSKEWWKN